MKLNTAASAVLGLLTASPAIVLSSSVNQSSNLRAAAAATQRHLEEEFEGTFVAADVQYADHHSEDLKWSIERDDGRIFELDEVSPSWAAEKGKELRSGETRLSICAEELPNGRMRLCQARDPTILRGNANGRPDGRRLAVTGTKTVAVVRVVAEDATTSQTEAQLSDNVFGTSGDTVNLSSQYTLCSHGKLNFVKSAQDNRLTNGVMTADIRPQTVTGLDNSVVRNAVSSAIGNASSLANHVMYCIPPGTSGGWIGYAYINSWLSVYNDNWCGYLSIQMHELGHNIGLAHAGETATYDDQSGMMGFSYSQDDGPKMCFNGAKNWQLGWFTDAQEEIVPATGLKRAVSLAGQVSYTGASGPTVLLKVPATGLDYYINFNHQTGYNSGTREGGNQVLITSRATGTGYAESDLRAKMSAGGIYTIADSDPQMKVKVESISSGIASLCISETGTCDTTPPTSSPTKAPTTSPTSSPTSSPTETRPTSSPTTSSPTTSPTASPTATPTASPTTSPGICVGSTTGNNGAECRTDAFCCGRNRRDLLASFIPEDRSLQTDCKPVGETGCKPNSPCCPGLQCQGSGNTKTCVSVAPTTAPPTPSPTATPCGCSFAPPPTPPPPTSPPVSGPTGCAAISGGGDCKAAGCTWSQGFCYDSGSGATSCENASCGADSECCSGFYCRGDGRCAALQ